MAANSKIEWCDHTFNPWVGCAHKVLDTGADHPACDHCYAEAFTKFTNFAKWGMEGTRVKTSETYWRQPLAWNAKAAKESTRARVFCASFADVFEDWPGPLHSHDGLALTDADMRAEDFAGHPIDMCREDLFTAIIDKTPHLDWLLLTKRPENIRRMWAPMLRASGVMADNHHRPNVWLGTSISDQATADAMIPELLACRDLAPVLFLSIEPLLGPIILPRTVAVCPHCGKDPNATGMRSSTDEPFAYYCNRRTCRDRYPLPSIDWVIVGGESGHHARPMHPDWARSVRDHCNEIGVPFLFKQWGEWEPLTEPSAGSGVCTGDGNHFRFIDRDGQSGTAGHPGHVIVHRVGKKEAGRELDGREWNEFPKALAEVA